MLICVPWSHLFFFLFHLFFPSPLHTNLLTINTEAHTCLFDTLSTFDAEMTEIKSWAFWRAVAAEFAGMLLFIFAGLTAIIGSSEDGVAQELKVSLAFALAIATLVQSLGHVSGAHFNPAVTLGLLVSGQISALRCVCYILAQMLGAVAASAIVNGYGQISSLGVNKARGRPSRLFFFFFSFFFSSLIYCDFDKSAMSYKPPHRF